MPDPKSPTDLATDRIRLFFAVPNEERIAVALTRFFAARTGPAVMDLRPEMTMGEVLELARDHLWTTPEFEHMLELAGIEAFDDQFEQMTFRDFVRYASSRNPEALQLGASTNGPPPERFGSSGVGGEPPSVS
jgi:hypothetical protein